MKYIFTLFLMLGLSISSNAELTSKMEHFVVKKDDDGKEVLKTASRVFPGEIVLYKMTFENTKKEILRDVDITGLIPAATNLIEDSVISLKDESVMFSIDNGVNWSEKPMKKVIVDGKITEIAAETYEYTNIKWKVPVFSENQTRVFEYRVLIKN